MPLSKVCLQENQSPSPHTQYKVWLKHGSEQSFLYGNHILKSGLGRITENTAQYQGVIMCSMNDTPLVSRSAVCVCVRVCLVVYYVLINRCVGSAN